jgi:hypothetical protein
VDVVTGRKRLCFVGNNSTSGNSDKQTDLKNKQLALAQPQIAKQDRDVCFSGWLSLAMQPYVLRAQAPAPPPSCERDSPGIIPEPI